MAESRSSTKAKTLVRRIQQGKSPCVLVAQNPLISSVSWSRSAGLQVNLKGEPPTRHRNVSSDQFIALATSPDPMGFYVQNIR